MILCGTGHRPDKLGGYGPSVAWHLTELARRKLRELQPELVISGMALGWDQALAWAAVAERIPFHAYVPFTGQEGRWPPKSKAEFAQLLALAEKSVVCSEGGYAPWKMQIRNERMVQDANCVLCLWDGSTGGTANCVAYANKVGTEVINVWDEWREMNGLCS